MKFSNKTYYALRTLVDLAQHRDKGDILIADIAARNQIPVKFLEQILLVLKGAGLVVSRRGPHGGYRLARFPEEINIAQVLQVTEGSFISKRASELFGEQFANGKCAVIEALLSARMAMLDKLTETTLAMLSERSRELKAEKVLDFAI